MRHLVSSNMLIQYKKSRGLVSPNQLVAFPLVPLFTLPSLASVSSTENYYLKSPVQQSKQVIMGDFQYKFKILFLILVAFSEIVVEVCAEDLPETVLHRQRRQLLYPYSTVLQVSSKVIYEKT